MAEAALDVLRSSAPVESLDAELYFEILRNAYLNHENVTLTQQQVAHFFNDNFAVTEFAEKLSEVNDEGFRFYVLLLLSKLVRNLKSKYEQALQNANASGNTEQQSAPLAASSAVAMALQTKGNIAALFDPSGLAFLFSTAVTGYIWYTARADRIKYEAEAQKLRAFLDAIEAGFELMRQKIHDLYRAASTA